MQKPFRLTAVVLFLSVFLAGCFSSSAPRLVEDRSTELITDRKHLDPTGPATQQVVVKALSRDGQPVAVEDLRIQGVTGVGDLIDIEVADAEDQVVETSTGTRSEITLTINIAELIEKGITQIQIGLKTDPLEFVVIALDPEDPGEDPGEPGDEPGGPGDPGEPEPPSQTVEVRTLRAGTSQATEAYIIRSSNPGPAIVVVGGVHGSETAGWMAAQEVAEWEIDAGTLVVIPEANRPAIQRARRTGPDGIDLARQFPVGRTPTTALAREIWDLVLEFQPVALMDLHEGWGIRRSGDRFPGGTLSVGQTIITYDAGDARTFANHVIHYMDLYHVRTVAQPAYSFMLIGPPIAGSIARKAGEELGIPAFTVEPTQKQSYLATRIRWHKVWVEELLRWYGLIENYRTLVPKEYNASVLPSVSEGVFQAA